MLNVQSLYFARSELPRTDKFAGCARDQAPTVIDTVTRSGSSKLPPYRQPLQPGHGPLSG